MSDHIESVLAAMAEADPMRGSAARGVIDGLTGGEALDMIDLASVQSYAWYTIPVKWMADLDGHMEAVDAAAEVLSRLGLDGYAAVFASEETARILAIYHQSEQAGFEAFRKAVAASGVEPPDLDDFAWGGVMGWQESSARTAVGRALETAMVAGELRPGASGWKRVAATVTQRTLDAELPDAAGQTLRNLVLTERLGWWVDAMQGRARRLHDLRSRHANRLLHPVPVPADVDERMAPVRWLLERTGVKLTLTQAGYVDTATVRDGAERFGWMMNWPERPPKSESEALELFELHQLLRRLGAVRRSGKLLTLIKRGQTWLDHPEAAWREMAVGLAPNDWSRAVAEVITLLYLDGVRFDHGMYEAAAEILAEVGWLTDGEPPGARVVMSGWYDVERPLRMLTATEEVGKWEERHTVLAPFAVDTLLEMTRAAAAGPRSSPW
ncbi:MAG: hypothetical protein ACFCVC_18455 [Acidimicrobiia bacterium]